MCPPKTIKETKCSLFPNDYPKKGTESNMRDQPILNLTISRRSAFLCGRNRIQKSNVVKIRRIIKENKQKWLRSMSNFFVKQVGPILMILEIHK